MKAPACTCSAPTAAAASPDAAAAIAETAQTLPLPLQRQLLMSGGWRGAWAQERHVTGVQDQGHHVMSECETIICCSMNSLKAMENIMIKDHCNKSVTS